MLVPISTICLIMDEQHTLSLHLYNGNDSCWVFHAGIFKESVNKGEGFVSRVAI